MALNVLQYEQSRPRKNLTGEERMETLTDEQMVEIEGGDWGGCLTGAGLGMLLMCLGF
jgi:hypothetical protein